MKKIIIFGLVALTIMSTSCESNKEVKQFASDFAAVVKEGDINKVKQMYPDVSEYDSLAIAFNADSVFVEKAEADNQFVVKLNSEQSMTVEKGQDGKFRVVKSNGVFAYKPGVVEFGKALGCYDPSLSDKENYERMNDKDFIGYLFLKAEDFLKKNVRIEQRTYYNKVGINIYNNTGINLPKDCYAVTVGVYFRGDGPASLESTQTYSEEDIPNGGSSHFFVNQIVDDLTYVEAEFTCNAYDMSSLQKIYKPTGDEYEKYQKGE